MEKPTMSDILKEIGELKKAQQKSHQELYQKIEDLSTKVDPVVDLYKNTTGGLKIIKYVLLGITILGGAIVALREIIKIRF